MTATDGTYTITPKPITLTVDSKTKTYGDSDPGFTANYGEEDLVGDDTVPYTLTRVEGEDVGTYTINAEASE